MRQADNLVIYGYNSTNQVTINNFFSNIYNKIESIEFSDSKLSYAELVKKNIEIYQNTTVSKSLAIPHEISINQEIQYLVSAMASFGKTEACIQIEEQHYSYLTPITLPN